MPTNTRPATRRRSTPPLLEESVSNRLTRLEAEVKRLGELVAARDQKKADEILLREEFKKKTAYVGDKKKDD